MSSPETRVAFVVRGVVRQAMADAGVESIRWIGAKSPLSELIERWCELRLQNVAPALTVSGANKTELLLAGGETSADLYPLGDLYASELSDLGGAAPLDLQLQDLAGQAGGIHELDAVLRKLLDERRPVAAAFADLPHIRDAVLMRLQKTRFRRAHLGVIPKVGARTIGIDLHS